MFMSLRASTSRAVGAARTLSTSSRAFQKAALQPSKEIQTPVDLLTKIGRGAEKKLATQAESWDGLTEVWRKGSKALEDAGLGIKDRRYILWAFSRYSQGSEPSEFISAPRPAKKYRGLFFSLCVLSPCCSTCGIDYRD